jgi:hypothetical protein
MILRSNTSNKKLGIIVCADDFGMSFEINNAIIKLLEHRKISAVSCLVTGKAWDGGSNLLKRFQGEVDIGLHLSFGNLPFNKILKLAYLKRVDRKIIFSEFKSQLSCFCKKLGHYPDFIDGHQHIHQLPVFRSALIDLVNIVRVDKVYIRNSSISLVDVFVRRISILKNILISIPGSSLKKYLFKKGIHTNNDLLGIYAFNTDIAPGKIFEVFLKTVKRSNSIFTVHPGYKNRQYNDKNSCLDIKREEEMKYLDSDNYKDALERSGFYLTRFIY